MSNNSDPLDAHNKLLDKLMKKRERALLIGRTKLMIVLDRRIAEIELEIDDLMLNH